MKSGYYFLFLSIHHISFNFKKNGYHRTNRIIDSISLFRNDERFATVALQITVYEAGWETLRDIRYIA